MGVIRKTQSVSLLLNEFEKNSKAISAIELVKRLADKINKTTVVFFFFREIGLLNKTI